MEYESSIPCPECGEEEMKVSTEKALGAALVNVIATADEV